MAVHVALSLTVRDLVCRFVYFRRSFERCYHFLHLQDLTLLTPTAATMLCYYTFVIHMFYWNQLNQQVIGVRAKSSHAGVVLKYVSLRMWLVFI